MAISKDLKGAFDATTIAAAGLSASRYRLDVGAANLANIETPGYKRRDVFQTAVSIPAEGSFSSILDRNTLSKPMVYAVLEDDSPARMEYRPNHPQADEKGYVALPNVNIVETMTDMMAASRLYQANATALQEARSMAGEARKILTMV